MFEHIIMMCERKLIALQEVRIRQAKQAHIQTKITISEENIKRCRIVKRLQSPWVIINKRKRDLLRAQHDACVRCISQHNQAIMFKHVTADTVFLLDLAEDKYVTPQRKHAEERLKHRLIVLRTRGGQ